MGPENLSTYTRHTQHSYDQYWSMSWLCGSPTNINWSNAKHSAKKQLMFAKDNYSSRNLGSDTNIIIMQQLGWEPLEQRRVRKHMIMFYKINHHIVEVQVHQLLQSTNSRTHGFMANKHLPDQRQDRCLQAFLYTSNHYEVA